jgi:hypothetical protein
VFGGGDPPQTAAPKRSATPVAHSVRKDYCGQPENATGLNLRRMLGQADDPVAQFEFDLNVAINLTG